MFYSSLISLVVLLLNISACQPNGSMNDCAPPERLPAIPKTAVWAGGVDGGAWIRCLLDQEKNANWCTVWDDQDGHVSARTYYVLRKTGAPVPESDLHYAFFSGTYIELADGRVLEPLAFHGKTRDLWADTPIEPPRDTSSEPSVNAKSDNSDLS